MLTEDRTLVDCPEALARKNIEVVTRSLGEALQEMTRWRLFQWLNCASGTVCYYVLWKAIDTLVTYSLLLLIVGAIAVLGYLHYLLRQRQFIEQNWSLGPYVQSLPISIKPALIQNLPHANAFTEGLQFRGHKSAGGTSSFYDVSLQDP